MQTCTFKVDQGTRFGKWSDGVSRFLYTTSTQEILGFIKIPARVADYGGANGNLKTFIPHAVSVDIDAAKNPDVVANILTYKGEFDLIVLRYVLHYLTDKQVLKLFHHIAEYHRGRVLVVQFVNRNLATKYANSRNEQKHFRTREQMRALLPANATLIYSKRYGVTAQFYRNRLQLKNAQPHLETVQAYYF